MSIFCHFQFHMLLHDYVYFHVLLDHNHNHNQKHVIITMLINDNNHITTIS